ncbi:hypothetical protein ZIOFF_045982 [Zingiber officinale]|uniref:Secreted protein n=1 Tax=Zingiber officinale TaxID=94328 RepID=A0A8J5G7U0_ZINOF|nr:hypothetical protein ZIOFF_045982 [Zingiber officinale]
MARARLRGLAFAVLLFACLWRCLSELKHGKNCSSQSVPPSSTPVKVHAVPIALFAITNMARSWSNGQRMLVFHAHALFSFPVFALPSASR